jgi:hypothetical protein
MVAGRRGTKGLEAKARLAPEPMDAADFVAAERPIAQPVARAHAADHPELFAPVEAGPVASESCGPLPAAPGGRGRASRKR